MSRGRSYECWYHAEEADRAAEAAQDHEAKHFYREIARRWREAAEQAERQHRWTSDRTARL